MHLREHFERISSGDWLCTSNVTVNHPHYGSVKVTAGTHITNDAPLGMSGWLDANWLERYSDASSMTWMEVLEVAKKT